MRRSFLLPVLLLAACIGQAGTTPNVIVFVADDAGWRDFGAYGHDTIRTPAIDRLASEGWTAENAFLTSPQCSPSRISILSGKYPHQTGTEDLHVALPRGERLLPFYLRGGGYFTGNMQKQHYGPHGAAQFDWYEDSLDIAAFLEAAGERPFFLWVGFRDPHRAYGDAPNVHSPDDVVVPREHVDTPETRADHVQYYDEIARLDSEIGRMVAALDARGLRDETYVIFISDNGAPMPRAKGTLYDAGIKTPMIVTGPGVPAGARYRPLVSVIDLAPTVLDWAGVAKPGDMIGNSIAAAIADPARPGRVHVFSQRDWHNIDEHMRSVRTDRYKLIWNNYVEHPHGTPADITISPTWQDLRRRRDAGRLDAVQSLLFEVPHPRVEFYDVQADPNEYDNLAGVPEYRRDIQKLMSALEAWIVETGDVPPDRRRRDNNTDRITGIKYSLENPPFIKERIEEMPKP